MTDSLREDFALRVSAVRGAVGRLIERDRKAGAGVREPSVDIGSPAAVIRALGIGLAAERLVDPEAIPAALFRTMAMGR